MNTSDAGVSFQSWWLFGSDINYASGASVSVLTKTTASVAFTMRMQTRTWNTFTKGRKCWNGTANHLPPCVSQKAYLQSGVIWYSRNFRNWPNALNVEWTISSWRCCLQARRGDFVEANGSVLFGSEKHLPRCESAVSVRLAASSTCPGHTSSAAAFLQLTPTVSENFRFCGRLSRKVRSRICQQNRWCPLFAGKVFTAEWRQTYEYTSTHREALFWSERNDRCMLWKVRQTDKFSIFDSTFFDRNKVSPNICMKSILLQFSRFFVFKSAKTYTCAKNWFSLSSFKMLNVPFVCWTTGRWHIVIERQREHRINRRATTSANVPTDSLDEERPSTRAETVQEMDLHEDHRDWWQGGQFVCSFPSRKDSCSNSLALEKTSLRRICWLIQQKQQQRWGVLWRPVCFSFDKTVDHIWGCQVMAQLLRHPNCHRKMSSATEIFQDSQHAHHVCEQGSSRVSEKAYFDAVLSQVSKAVPNLPLCWRLPALGADRPWSSVGYFYFKMSGSFWRKRQTNQKVAPPVCDTIWFHQFLRKPHWCFLCDLPSFCPGLPKFCGTCKCKVPVCHRWRHRPAANWRTSHDPFTGTCRHHQRRTSKVSSQTKANMTKVNGIACLSSVLHVRAAWWNWRTAVQSNFFCGCSF